MAYRSLFLLINIICSFLFSSCSDELITGSQAAAGTGSSSMQAEAGPSLAPGDSLIGSGVSQAGNAYRLVSRWVLDHYEAEQGIILGTWPRHERYQGERLKELHYLWGFNYLLLSHIYDMERFNITVASGFPAARILVSISPDTYVKNIHLFGSGIYGFYCDEPADRNYPLETMNAYRKANAPSKPLFISGYKRTARLDSFVLATDGVAFSSYGHWYPLFGYWVSWPENPDQRQDWTDMQQRYGSKYSYTWIGAHRDLLEYDLLLEHARKLGLKSIWLYQHEDETDDLNNTNVGMFALYAWKHRFLVRYERREILRIENALSDDNLQEGSASKENWTVKETIPTRQLRTVAPGDRPELFNK